MKNKKNLPLTRRSYDWDFWGFITDNPELHYLLHIVADNILRQLELCSACTFKELRHVLFNMQQKKLSWKIVNQRIIIAALLAALSIPASMIIPGNGFLTALPSMVLLSIAGTTYLCRNVGEYQRICYWRSSDKQEDEIFIRLSYGVDLVQRLQGYENRCGVNRYLQSVKSVEELKIYVHDVLRVMAQGARLRMGESQDQSIRDEMNEIIALSFAAFLFVGPSDDEKVRVAMAKELYRKAFDTPKEPAQLATAAS